MTSFLKGVGFDVCLPLAALLPTRKLCFYLGCNDLASLSGTGGSLTCVTASNGCEPARRAPLRYISRFLYSLLMNGQSCVLCRLSSHTPHHLSRLVNACLFDA